MNHFIVAPLVTIMFISLFALLAAFTPLGGLGGINIAGIAKGDLGAEVYYDYGGNPKLYYNLTAYAESGEVICDQRLNNHDAEWYNASSSKIWVFSPKILVTYFDTYQLYLDANHISKVDITKMSPQGYEGRNTTSINLSSSTGLLMVVVAVIALGAVAGIRVLSSGVSDTSIDVIVKGSAYLGVWAVFSVIAMGLIMLIPNGWGSGLYFVLTAFYAIGVIDSFGHPSGGD